jgi:hypothetical protein
MNGIKILIFLKTNSPLSDLTSESAVAGTGATDEPAPKSVFSTILLSPTISTLTRTLRLTGSALPGTSDFHPADSTASL